MHPHPNVEPIRLSFRVSSHPCNRILARLSACRCVLPFAIAMSACTLRHAHSEATPIPVYRSAASSFQFFPQCSRSVASDFRLHATLILFDQLRTAERTLGKCDPPPFSRPGSSSNRGFSGDRHHESAPQVHRKRPFFREPSTKKTQVQARQEHTTKHAKPTWFSAVNLGRWAGRLTNSARQRGNDGKPKTPNGVARKRLQKNRPKTRGEPA